MKIPWVGKRGWWGSYLWWWKNCAKNKIQTLTYSQWKSWFECFTEEPWEFIEAPLVHVTMLFTRGTVTMSWVLQTRFLNNRIWCKWWIGPTTAGEDLREQWRLLNVTLNQGKAKILPRSLGKSILRNERDPERSTKMCRPRPATMDTSKASARPWWSFHGMGWNKKIKQGTVHLS